MKKRSVLLGGLLAFGALCSIGGVGSWNAKAETGKVIDVYVIAGQSNAAGCAMVSSLDAARKKDVYTSGFENIYFYGKVDVNESINSNGPFDTFDNVVKFGQGFDDDRFGAEIGIADMIAKSGTQNESIIVKYASGSLDITNHWCPPSQRGDSQTKGAWYDGCMDTVQEVIAHYADLDYTVNLKGTFWMQGEAESENGNGGIYEAYLTSLIGDMREDYAEMFNSNDAKSAPFVIGKIAPTYNYGVATQTETVRAAQDKVAKTLENVYTAETERYIIVDPTTGNRAPGCVDNWHFNGNDMLALGTQVGNLILNGGEKKTVAMYLIAGQSNASGYSLVSQVAATYRNEHADGFKNVYYYGRADHVYYDDFHTIVKFGQGRSNSQFGAEIGIAEKHMAAYPDQEAIIVKYAMGATYLVDTANGVTSEHGNWCPPSRGYKLGALSGKLYNAFIDRIEQAVDYYYDMGYEIDLKGTFWMQGEAEADGSYAEDKGDYKSSLKALISDLRNDYAEILNDEIAKQSPFVIGKICPTFNGANDDGGVGAVRRIQDAVATEMSRVYLVETEKYPMVDPITGSHRGPDKFHFEGNDMVSLGQDVGETFITVGQAHVRVKVEGYGKASTPEYIFLTDTTASKDVTFTPTRDRYVITSVTYDGVDVTAQLVNGTFTITDTQGNHELVATFDKEPKYAVEVDADEAMVTILRDPLAGKHYAGEKVKITVNANTGYKVTSITWNGVAVNTTGGTFEITVQAGENKVCVEAASDGSAIESNRPQKPTEGDKKPSIDPITSEKGGCSGIVGAMPVGLAALGLGVICLLKKKEK